MNPVIRQKLLYAKNRFDDEMERAFSRIQVKKDRLKESIEYAVENGEDEEEVYNLLGYEDPRLVSELFGVEEEETV